MKELFEAKKCVANINHINYFGNDHNIYNFFISHKVVLKHECILYNKNYIQK
jgi:hypothetical protein